MKRRSVIHEHLSCALGLRCSCICLRRLQWAFRSLGRRGGLRRTATLVFDFDQTHAAVAGYRQTVVVAEPGDLSPGEFRDLKNAHPVFEFDFNTVHDGFGHDDTRLW